MIARREQAIQGARPSGHRLRRKSVGCRCRKSHGRLQEIPVLADCGARLQIKNRVAGAMRSAARPAVRCSSGEGFAVSLTSIAQRASTEIQHQVDFAAVAGAKEDASTVASHCWRVAEHLLDAKTLPAATTQG